MRSVKQKPKSKQRSIDLSKKNNLNFLNTSRQVKLKRLFKNTRKLTKLMTNKKKLIDSILHKGLLNQWRTVKYYSNTSHSLNLLANQTKLLNTLNLAGRNDLLSSSQ